MRGYMVVCVAAAVVAAASAAAGVRGGRQQLLGSAAEDHANVDSSLALECEANGLPKGWTPHPKYDQILTAIRALAKPTWDATSVLFRVQDVEYPRIIEITNGLGAKNAGGRWGPKCLPAVYLARTDITALEECRAVSVRAGEVQTYPRLIVALFYRGGQYLDLSTPALMGALATASGVAADIATTEQWHAEQSNRRESWTQAVGRAAVAAGVKAILVASAAHPGGLNMVVYPGNDPASVLDVDAKERLETLIKVGTMTEAQLAAARGAGANTEPVQGVGYPNLNGDEMQWMDNPVRRNLH